MTRPEKAFELLGDSIRGEDTSQFGGIAGELPDDLTSFETEAAYPEFETDARCIDETAGIYVGENGREQVRLYGYFSYITKTELPHVPLKEESDADFTPEGEDDSREDVWGTEYERKRMRVEGHNDYDEREYIDVEAHAMSIKLEEIVGVKSGVKVTLEMRLDNRSESITYTSELKNILNSPKFGTADIVDTKQITLTYDMILGDVDSYGIYGVRIFNTLVETMIQLYHSVNKIVSGPAVSAPQVEYEELEY